MTQMLKECRHCWEIKPESEFAKDGVRIRARCRACTNAAAYLRVKALRMGRGSIPRAPNCPLKRSDGKVFPSLNAAAKQTGTTVARIRTAVKNNAECAGFKWERA